MLQKSILYTALLLAAAVLFGGCNSRTYIIDIGSSTVEIENASDTTGSENATVTKSDILFYSFKEGFDERYIIINTYTMSIGYTDAENLILTRMRYVQKAKKIAELIPVAVNAAYEKACELYPDKFVSKTENITYPEWQYLAATLIFAEDEDYLIKNILCVEINTQETDNSLFLSFNAAPTPIREFAQARAKEAGDDANVYNDIRYTYAYLKALYDENGDDIIAKAEAANSSAVNAETTPEPVYYNFGYEYEKNLVYPLQSVPNFYDTWAQGRSNNTRRHMGTDIINHEGNPVYSVTSGTVLYKGTDKIPGNFVIVLDDYGFEYHYYHLIEIPKEVNRGDRVDAGTLIAHVGDTGNSDASHLHISIISPDGVFLNPYKLMRTLADRIDKE